MAETKEWKYCVVGNIVRTHLDDSGVLRYGTLTYSGGTRIYLEGKYWSPEDSKITVVGQCRGKRFLVDRVPVELIENVRCSRVYKPRVLEIMNYWEFEDLWWHNTTEDKRETEAFVSDWNSRFHIADEASD